MAFLCVYFCIGFVITCLSRKMRYFFFWGPLVILDLVLDAFTGDWRW